MELITKILKKDLFENSLGKETIDDLGLRSMDALEKEVELLTKEMESEQIRGSYKC